MPVRSDGPLGRTPKRRLRSGERLTEEEIAALLNHTDWRYGRRHELQEALRQVRGDLEYQKELGEACASNLLSMQAERDAAREQVRRLREEMLTQLRVWKVALKRPELHWESHPCPREGLIAFTPYSVEEFIRGLEKALAASEEQEAK